MVTNSEIRFQKNQSKKGNHLDFATCTLSENELPLPPCLIQKIQSEIPIYQSYKLMFYLNSVYNLGMEENIIFYALRILHLSNWQERKKIHPKNLKITFYRTQTEIFFRGACHLCTYYIFDKKAVIEFVGFSKV
jgi:hypothetical protein